MPQGAVVPKVKYAKPEEGLGMKTEATLMQAGGRKPITIEQRDLIRNIAKAYGLPITGITLLGGKPYVNMTGLDGEIEKKWLTKGWVKEEYSEPMQEATKDNDWLARYRMTIKFFDQKSFMKILEYAVKEHNAFSPEQMEKLQVIFTRKFSFEGWASPDTCEGIAYKYEWSEQARRKIKGALLRENVNMMAERRCSNRTKRAAVGCGLTSLEEIAGVDSGLIDIESEVVPEEKPEKPEPQKPPTQTDPSITTIFKSLCNACIEAGLVHSEQDFDDWLATLTGKSYMSITALSQLSTKEIEVLRAKIREQLSKAPRKEERVESGSQLF